MEAQRLGTEFLGEVPLLLDIRTASDAARRSPRRRRRARREGVRRVGGTGVGEKVAGAEASRSSGPKIVIE